jgi:acetyl-CoA synthetase
MALPIDRSFEHSRETFWRPTADFIEQAHLTEFMRQNGIAALPDLMERSTQDVAWFTDAVLRYLDIRFRTPYRQVLDLSRGLAFPQWCLGGRMNIVENCLDKYIGTSTENRTALIWEGENGQTRALTYADLFREVNRAANGLRARGLGKGDAIGLYMPMVPELIIAFLAIAKIGGIILPLFSGYGAGAVASRLSDADAKALFTADGYFRRGKSVQMKPVADEAAAQVPTLKHIIVLPYAGLDLPLNPSRDVLWQDMLSGQPAQTETEDTSAEDVLMVIYTSGTSGIPKGAVHTHCGFPVKAAQDMAFGTDVHPGQILYWITDMGWMMGPWETFGALILGAAFFIYDGAPDYPGPDRLWAMIERHRITTLGISPTLIRSLIPAGDEAVLSHDLSSLRLISMTGEPCNPEPWKWLFERVGKSRLPIINYTGGTEISGGILMGNPLLPMKPCSFNSPCPGMAADVFDETGHPVREQVGELVIRAPWIGMTRGFWKDPERYLDTYWSRWPDTWVHGDWAAVDDEGQWYVTGRSDDTIKVAGKRIGPAEVESILIEHPAVLESAAIGVPDLIKGSQLVAFCVLKPGVVETEALRHELSVKIVADMGKALAPKAVYFVDDIPKTRNAKLLRRMIRSAYLDLAPGDTSALVNPEALESIRHPR